MNEKQDSPRRDFIKMVVLSLLGGLFMGVLCSFFTKKNELLTSIIALLLCLVVVIGIYVFLKNSRKRSTLSKNINKKYKNFIKNEQ